MAEEQKNPLEDPKLDLNDIDAVNALIEKDAKAAGIDPGAPPVRNDKGQFVSTKPDPKDEDLVYQKTISIAGKEFTFEADSEEEVNAQVEAAYQAALATAQRPVTQEKVVDPKIAEQEQADLNSLWLKAVSGDRAAYDAYQEKSGAIDKFIEKKYGVKVSDLKEVVEQNRTNRSNQAWAVAVEEFKKDSSIEYSLNKTNETLMGGELSKLNLWGTPSKESLVKAYNSLKEKGIEFITVKKEAEQEPTTTEPQKKKRNSSLLINAGTQHTDRNAQKLSTTPTAPSQEQVWAAIEKAGMSMEEAAIWWNTQVAKSQTQS